MLIAQLIHTGFPVLHLGDKCARALQLMDDYDVLHLPLQEDDRYLGLVSKADLLDLDEQDLLAAVEINLHAAVKGEEHFFKALHQMAQHQLSVLPVLNPQQEMQGVLLLSDLLPTLSLFLGNEEPGAVIVLETEKRHFSFGEISRLVETNDAYITQLNTYTEASTGLCIVTIKVNKTEVSDIVATFQRYDYSLRYYFGEEAYGNELKENYRHLLSYLNM